MSIKTSIYILTIFILSIPSMGMCQQSRVGKKPGVLKKKYVHACPGGTERVGDPPPKKSKVIFCRQILQDGSRLEGDYIQFYRNGNKKSEGEYIAGKRQGTWTSYYREGQLAEKKEFVDGKIVEKVSYSKRGGVIKDNDPKDKKKDKENAESEFSKTLRYKKSAKSPQLNKLSWAPRRSNRR